MAAAAFLASCAAATAQTSAVDRGLAFATTNCAPCHAIGKTGDSPNGEAPALRTLHERYPVENLEEALAEGIVVGHPDMPQFQLTPLQIEALIAYLKTLER
jgi:mono/diheme cytochrome c family protein